MGERGRRRTIDREEENDEWRHKWRKNKGKDRYKRLILSGKKDKPDYMEKTGCQDSTRQREARSLAIVAPYSSLIPGTVNGWKYIKYNMTPLVNII